MKRFSKCPLFLALVFSALIMSVIGRCHLNDSLRDYQEKVENKPALAAVFMGVKDGVYFWEEPVMQTFAPGEAEDGPDGDGMSDGNGALEGSVVGAPQSAGNNAAGTAQSTDGDANGGAQLANNDAADRTGAAESSAAGSNTAGIAQAANNDAVGTTPSATNSAAGGTQGTEASASESNPSESSRTYEFVHVEEDYFDDALFIGDSRTQGMLEYGGLEERADFYCKTSLTVHDLFEKQKAYIRIGEEELTLEEALGRKQFGKIYLMLGINELGTGTPETFLASYAAAVDKIRQLQPDAVIFVQSIMRVAGEKSASDAIYNNANINARNELLKTLADDRDIFYIDVNEAVCDENGDLHSEWTFDQIHLKAKYYEVWKEVLKEHGIERNDLL